MGRSGRFHRAEPIRFAVILLLVLVWAAPTLAGPLQDGLAAYKRGDYATAAKDWQTLAEQGDDNAKCDIGYLYAAGQGVPRDYARTLYWWRLAAKDGYVRAEEHLGILYNNGTAFLPYDPVKGVHWFWLAAKQGDAFAQLMIAYAYEDGKGVPKNLAKAFNWLRFAAYSGLLPAQVKLGFAYEAGSIDGSKGTVPKNFVKAYKWLDIAIAHDRGGPGSFAPERDSLAKRMIVGNVAEAQDLAAAFKPLSHIPPQKFAGTGRECGGSFLTK